MNRSRRLLKEIEDVKSDTSSGVTLILPDAADLTRLKGTFLGPPDTPYANGVFTVDIQIPDEYPFKPPIMRFDTRIYHPNVSSQTGAICLDVLKNAWTPILTLKSSLISLQGLLESPQPDDPQDAVVAKVLIEEPEKFKETAKNWTEIYAGKANAGADGDVSKEGDVDEETLNMFEEMGFERDDVEKVLKKLGLTSVRADDMDTQDKVIQQLSVE